MITDKELNFVQEALQSSLRLGAQKARATLSKSEEDLVATLDGEVDRVTHCADRSLSLALFVDGKFGSYSTNKLEPEALEAFIAKAVEATRMVAEDPCRDLPDPARCCSDALTGDELGLIDPARSAITPDSRQQIALQASVYHIDDRIISEEGEYSDSLYETLLMDTNGVCCRHSEMSFDYGVEITVESGGEKYSGYWWDASSHRDGLDAAACGRKALERAVGQIGSKPAPGGRYTAVIDTETSSKLVSPLLRALSGFSIQQHNSYLMDRLGGSYSPKG